MILDRFRIDEQVAVVTGAGRGIGAATAVALAEAGADVVLAARTEDQLEAVAGRIEAAGRRAHIVTADLSDQERPIDLPQHSHLSCGHSHVRLRRFAHQRQLGFLTGQQSCRCRVNGFGYRESCHDGTQDPSDGGLYGRSLPQLIGLSAAQGLADRSPYELVNHLAVRKSHFTFSWMDIDIKAVRVNVQK